MKIKIKMNKNPEQLVQSSAVTQHRRKIKFNCHILIFLQLNYSSLAFQRANANAKQCTGMQQLWEHFQTEEQENASDDMMMMMMLQTQMITVVIFIHPLCQVFYRSIET